MYDHDNKIESIFYSEWAEAQITLPSPLQKIMYAIGFHCVFHSNNKPQVGSKERQSVYKCSLLLF